MFVHTEGYVAFFTPPIHNFRLYLDGGNVLGELYCIRIDDTNLTVSAGGHDRRSVVQAAKQIARLQVPDTQMQIDSRTDDRALVLQNSQG